MASEDTTPPNDSLPDSGSNNGNYDDDSFANDNPPAEESSVETAELQRVLEVPVTAQPRNRPRTVVVPASAPGQPDASVRADETAAAAPAPSIAAASNGNNTSNANGTVVTAPSSAPRLPPHEKEQGWINDSVTFADFEVDESGKPVSIRGMLFSTFHCKVLRSLCSHDKFKLNGVSKCTTKADYIAFLVDGYKNKDVITAVGGIDERLTPNCRFRILNIIFDDSYATKFIEAHHTTGTIPETGGGKEAAFWKEAETEFQNPEKYYGVYFTSGESDKVDLLLREKTSFIKKTDKILPHNAKRLRAIYQEITRKYRDIHFRYTRSSSHQDFWNFCGGCITSYYLHKLLQDLKPNLLATVNKELPPDSFMTTEDIRAIFLEDDGT
ncbi:hypothetical protein FisN_41Hu010, partial [Fistulifera solaris]